MAAGTGNGGNGRNGPHGLRRRRVAIGVLAVAAFAVGIIAGRGSGDDGPGATAARFASAWERGDFLTMWRELSPAARSRLSAGELRTAYRNAARTATLSEVSRAGRVRVGPERSGRRAVAVPILARTNAFGVVHGTVELRIGDDGIAWDADATFPGLRRGERLQSEARIGERGRILAADGSALAQGPSGERALSSPAAKDVTGETGPALPEDVDRMHTLGYPIQGPVGISGLERAYQAPLAGRPGGTLFAVGPSGRRQLAATRPADGRDVHTTIRPRVQAAAVAGLAGRLGGVAVLDTRTGEVLAVAGLAYSAPQPPGSTFKIVTAAAALHAGKAKMDSSYPVVTQISVGGRAISNAHGESCGGTFIHSFAHSCNSVFAPLGQQVGSKRLVAQAKKLGFNRPPALFDPATTRAIDVPPSSLPAHIDSDLDLGVTAIGQGKVLATPLEMASISATVARRGIVLPTPIARDAALRPRTTRERAMPAGIARRLTTLMRAVVAGGTGIQGALPGIQVAGKTGTAELGIPKPGAAGQPPPPPGAEEEQEVNAWFTAFAPADRPRVALAVMLVNADGDGGAVAAPVARELMKEALVSTAPKPKPRRSKGGRGRR